MAMAFPTDCLPPAYSKKKAKNYLPPEGYFESREALFVSINAWAKSRGYEFTTQRSIRELLNRLLCM